MHPHYPNLFKTAQLRGKTLRNRVVFGAHTANMSVQGLPTERHAAYYRERAMGGAAMVVVEPMPVHAAAVLTRGNFKHSSDEVVPHFRKVTEAVKAEGAVVLQQLYHVGQHGDADNSYHANWSPSGGPSYHDSDGSHMMSEGEIEETIDAYAQAARRCHEAGFDGIELFAAYHALIDQFWTPWSNLRDDTWGGSLENRTRFSREICARIRKICGDDFIIGLAVSDEPDFDVALSREHMCEIVERHERDSLIDYVTCGSGGYLDFYKLMPTFLYPEKLTVDLASTLKGIVKHTLVTSESHIRTPDNAEDVLRSGQSDLASIVRGQIADPHLVNKAKDNRTADIRGCLSCNQMCWGRRSRDYWISCLVNPSVGREWEWGGDRFEPAQHKKRVLVVGGGPAGLETARVAAERGHQVTLAEAAPELGGQFRLAGLQPRRSQIGDLITWYETQLTKLQVKVERNTYIEADDVPTYAPDCVVVATGALPRADGHQKFVPNVAELPGLDFGHVWTAEDVMSNQARLGSRVVLVDDGGNWRGCGTALKLAEDGKTVTLVTPDPVVGKELQRTAADFPLRKRLAELGVTFICESAVTNWGAGGADVTSFLTGATQQVEADDLVFATTGSALDELARDMQDDQRFSGIDVHLIGDAEAPRQAPYAIHDGRKTGLSL